MQEIFLSKDWSCEAHWRWPQGIPISEQLNVVGHCLLEKVSSGIWTWACQVQVWKVAMDNHNMFQWNRVCWNGGVFKKKYTGNSIVFDAQIVHNLSWSQSSTSCSQFTTQFNSISPTRRCSASNLLPRRCFHPPNLWVADMLTCDGVWRLRNHARKS